MDNNKLKVNVMLYLGSKLENNFISLIDLDKVPI